MLMVATIGLIAAGLGLVVAADVRGFTARLGAHCGRLTGRRSAAFSLPLRLFAWPLVLFGLLVVVLALNNL